MLLLFSIPVTATLTTVKAVLSSHGAYLISGLVNGVLVREGGRSLIEKEGLFQIFINNFLHKLKNC